jgi:hypothetical protein
MSARWAVAACAAALVAGCAGEDPAPTVDPEQPTVSSSVPGSSNGRTAETDGSSPGTDGGTNGGTDGGTDETDDGGGTSATEELVLSQQVQLVTGGDGLSPSCDLTGATPPSFRQDPGVWLHELFSQTEYPRVVNLCLRGFRADQPIQVEVTTDDYTTASTVQPVDDTPPEPDGLGYEDAPETTLFDPSGTLPVYTRSDDGGPFGGPPGTMSSRMWTFVPPPAAREALASSGEMTVTATQGSTTATEVHPISVPARRASFTVDTSDGQMLVVHGYPEGRLPLGLYLRDESFESGTLVREAGTVEVPASQVATWPVPGDLFDGLEPGDYCLLPPVESETDCDITRVRPPFPGEAVVGDSGDVVKAWQEILIAAGVMSDIPENRDGVYGPATQEAVSEYLSLNGLEDPYDGSRLDQQLYDVLTN